MDLTRIAKSEWGCVLALTLAKILPRKAAYALGDTLFRRLASQRHLSFVRGVEQNLSALLGLPEEHPDVEAALQSLFRQTCRSYVDFSQAAAQGGPCVAGCCRIDPRLYALLEQAAVEGRGLVLVGIHTCSFDFAMVALGN
jgi:lauroyl/myristoyl acyltransferase